MALETGLTGEMTTTVVHENTAAHVGAGGVEVFATPMMIALMENASWKAVADHLDEDDAPQVVKTWRTRSTADISLEMFLILVAGIIAWLTYGALIRDVPLVLANAVTLLLAGTILFFKLRNG